MATKKDLVEAYSFSKRRLVTAFLSGAPGGREVEPSKPGRTIIGGVALAVLLTAGAAVTGVFKPRTDAGWQEPGLVTSKERATDYVILEPANGDDGGDPVLRPLINITTAMLLFGSDIEATRVPEDDLSTLEVGEQIGILDAPGSPPAADALIQSGWTACTTGDAVKVTVSEERETSPAADKGFLVKRDKQGKELYLIAHGDPVDVQEPRAYAYRLPKMDDEQVRSLTGSIPGDAPRVPGEWLALFPPGETLDLDSLRLGEVGTRVSYAGEGGIPRQAEVGDWYESSDRAYALAEDGPVELTPFARELVGIHRPKQLSVSATSVGLQTRTYGELPRTVPNAASGELCAELTPDQERPVVRLAERPGPDASAGDVAEGEVRRHVDSGAGSYVRSGSWEATADRGSGDDAEGVPTVAEEVLIDSRGRSYALQGAEAAERLGFGAMTAPVAPESWVELFEEGVTLSVSAATCPPVRDDDQEPCE